MRRATNAQPSKSSMSLAAELDSLAKLNEAGALSDAEFAAAKQRVLGIAAASPVAVATVVVEPATSCPSPSKRVSFYECAPMPDSCPSPSKRVSFYECGPMPDFEGTWIRASSEGSTANLLKKLGVPWWKRYGASCHGREEAGPSHLHGPRQAPGQGARQRTHWQKCPRQLPWQSAWAQ